MVGAGSVGGPPGGRGASGVSKGGRQMLHEDSLAALLKPLWQAVRDIQVCVEGRRGEW